MKVITSRFIDESLFVKLDRNGAEVVVEAEIMPGLPPHICEITWGETGEPALPDVIDDLDDIRTIVEKAALASMPA